MGIDREIIEEVSVLELIMKINSWVMIKMVNSRKPIGCCKINS
jgi:hypothetical protein